MNKELMQSKRGERGQALVEGGLVMVVFISVLAGIMDFGQFLYLHQSLSERCRAGARYGAINTYTNSGLAAVNVTIYNDPNGSTDGATPLLANLQSSASGSNGYVSATLTNPGTDSALITVTITNYPYNFLWMPSDLNTRTVTATEPYEIGR